MIILRTWRGIADHFPARVTEWLMIWPAFGMGLALTGQPEMFQTSPSFAVLASWADERTWATLVLTCAAARAVALVVNGTFDAFRHSPILRGISALVAIVFWSQFCLGLLMAAVYAGGSWSGPVIYSTAVLAEIINVFRSWSDVGRTRPR
ncbi:hypothetical protein [Rubellimicrobium arenae]|uniref:hypothetical protein n=1 Tax=Rubellimicrobium arenae TaxID=2817372 RepID=UPI001B3180D8|nr:hypothetical protein [Rubellimicrobium arenae]